MIDVDTNVPARIQQGDIYKDINYFEEVEIFEGEVRISKIVFPLVIVLTQDCDLEQDSAYRVEVDPKPSTDDKKLLSAIVAPIYNEEQFLMGEHFSDETLGLRMQIINKISKGKPTTQYTNLINNEIARYHYLEFPSKVQIVNSVIDFKHYFTVNINHLMMLKDKKFICKVSELYREKISQRFAYFLSRIGLPNQ